jgi:hypothetical protein
MNAEEKVFTIPGLRLLILSFYLPHPDEKGTIKCYQKFKNNINNKFNYCIMYIFLRFYSSYFR